MCKLIYFKRPTQDYVRQCMAYMSYSESSVLHVFSGFVGSANICKAGPALLMRIRINIVFVFNPSYSVLEPYLSYLTVGKTYF